MAGKALIIVDVQNDFCPDGSLAVSDDADQIIEPINRASDFATQNNWKKIVSRDKHRFLTFIENTIATIKKAISLYTLGWYKPQKTHFEKWPIHCVENTKGCEFHPRLNVQGATIITKGINPYEDGYSAFEGRDEQGRLLENVLRDASITEVYIAGLATDYCVKATAIDAAGKYHFKTYLLLDACRAVNRELNDEKNAIEEMQQAKVIITTTDEVIKGNI